MILEMLMDAEFFKGDERYCVDCTGDAVVGDTVCFDKAIFTGSFRSPVFSHYERVEGEIINDSYGAEKQQHTFTIKLNCGVVVIIKGRNLYRNGLFRQPWQDEAQREILLAEKHKRGDRARAQRDFHRSGHDE